jgi:hypothetical protein
MTAEHITITLALLIRRDRRIALSSEWRHARADPLRRVCGGDWEATNAVRLRYRKRTTGVPSAASTTRGRPVRANAQSLPNPYGAPVTTEVARKVAAGAIAEA